MDKWKHKDSKKELMHSPLVLIFLSVVLIIFLYNVVFLVQKARDTKKKKLLAEEEIVSLKKKQDDLNKEIEKLSTDEGIEEVLRDKYQLVHPGEKIAVVVEDKKADNPIEVDKNEGIFSFFKNLFK